MSEVWTNFQESCLTKALADADNCLKLPLDKADPYKNRYAAADALSKAKATAQATLKAGGLSDVVTSAFRNADAVLEARWALILMDTDKQSAAAEALERSVKVLAENPFQHILLLQDVFNQKGLAWSKSDFKKSVDCLQQAEELYKAWHASWQSPSDAEQGRGGEQARNQEDYSAQPLPRVIQSAKNKYAHTLFYLAQLFATAGEQDSAAEYCAETLAVQLEIGMEDPVEWAENCEQVAIHYLRLLELAVVQHLLICTGLALKQSSDPAAEAVRERQASLALNWAKWFSTRLSLSNRAQSNRDVYQPEITELPEKLRYPLLKPPDPKSLLWDGGLAQNMEEAKDIFNAGMRMLKEALTYFDMEKHLLTHCNAILEISEMYRWLADSEKDSHKKCVLHKARAKRVQPLLKRVREQDNVQLYKTLQLDIGNAYREITEIKFEEGRPFEKVAAAAKEAIPYYEAYINTFRTNGKLPERLEDQQMAEQYIHTVFYLARVTSRLDPPVTSGVSGRTENLREAVVLYRYCATFIRENGITAEEQLAQTCLEMASLIQENSEMIRVTKNRRMRQVS